MPIACVDLSVVTDYFPSHLRLLSILFFFFLITENPTATIIPPLMTFQSRDKVTITCQVSGFPVPSILWFKDDILMEFDKRISVVEGSLVIRDAQMSDAGEYECNAWNIVGQSKATVKLLYTGKLWESMPQIKTNSKTRTIPRARFSQY